MQRCANIETKVVWSAIRIFENLSEPILKGLQIMSRVFFGIVTVSPMIAIKY